MATTMRLTHTLAFILGTCALALSSQTALADISFEKTIAIAQTTENSPPVAIAYPFKNTGNNPVTITRVKVSCGCMSTRKDNKVYQPGETGEVLVWFNPAGRSGLQKRTISVHVQDGQKKKKHLLGLELNIEAH